MNPGDKSLMGSQGNLSSARPPMNEIMDQLKSFLNPMQMSGQGMLGGSDAGKIDLKNLFMKPSEQQKSKGGEKKTDGKDEDKKENVTDPEKRIIKVPDLISLFNDIEIPLTHMNEGLYLNLCIYALVGSSEPDREGGA